MNEKIRKHINELFASAPKTRKAMDLKEEMTQNTIEKYDDLIREGYQPEDAYENVISSIGDVTELFEDLEEKNLLTLPESDRRRRAMLTSISVGLYIFAGIAFFICQIIREMSFIDAFGWIGLVCAALICIPPTCMLVYAANMYPAYRKKDDSLVEIYKEAKHTNNRDKAVRASVSAIIWTVVMTLYFVISFTTYAWHVTWIIFLIGACGQAIAELVFSLRRNS